MTNNNDNKSMTTLFGKFITEQFKFIVPATPEELEAFIEEHFNSDYNLHIQNELADKGQYSKEEMEYINKVIDEAVEDFGYDLVKGKSFNERMELFIYLEAKRIGNDLIELCHKQRENQVEPVAPTDEEKRNFIVDKILNKYRGRDAVFRDLFAIPIAKHSPATFYVSGEGFENHEVQDDMDALFGINDNQHKTMAGVIVKEAIDKHQARFGKSQHDNYLFLEVEREEVFRQIGIRDKTIAELTRKSDCDAKMIAELKKQLKDYKDNGYDEEELQEQLKEKEEEVLDGLYCGGEWSYKWQEIVDEGRCDVLREIKEWATDKILDC